MSPKVTALKANETKKLRPGRYIVQMTVIGVVDVLPEEVIYERALIERGKHLGVVEHWTYTSPPHKDGQG